MKIVSVSLTHEDATTANTNYNCEPTLTASHVLGSTFFLIYGRLIFGFFWGEVCWTIPCRFTASGIMNTRNDDK